MTISSTTRKAGPFDGNNVLDAFPFAFKVFADSDVVVVKTDPDDIETTLTLTTDYTVSLNADQDTSPGGHGYAALGAGDHRRQVEDEERK
ncbi:hypothetical protein [Thiobacillus denitrificans]|uniref:Uncharacterized protein n=1 Tax=Thiobacillus denitrificans TaxID=36861 RepID=A0A106BIX3_THIDE|nr:hypothetical protein [Thiobacillus denitrificans]KVW93337.1 hypothetical protein ABW22_14490 [Thiobacillus denitrificans]